MPSAVSASSASGVVALIGSAMASMPASLPSMAMKITVAPSRAQSLGLARRAASVVNAELLRNLALPSATCLAFDRPDHALAGRRVEASTRRAATDLALRCRRDDGSGQRVLASPLDTGREAQHFILVEALRRNDGDDCGLPSVSVPVLSTTSVSTFSMRSSASAFLISTPAWAPRPTPTMIDIGVASPSAQDRR